MKFFKTISTVILLVLVPIFGAYAFADGTEKDIEQDVRTIEVIGNDQMKFDVTEITAKPGEKIRIRLTTVSKLSKQVMAHNIVVLKSDTDAGAFANASAMARDNEYIAPDFEDQIIAATELAGGGETVTVTFTVPEEPGKYPYVCSFPGHFYGGMKGVLTVKQ